MPSESLARMPASLAPGAVIALVSPASWSERAQTEQTRAMIESWGFRPRLVAHVHDRLGYLAGSDQDRLADLNDALRDLDVRTIVCLRGGCGSFRLLHGVDVYALEADPKPLVGFSDITALHRVGTCIVCHSFTGPSPAHIRTLSGTCSLAAHARR